jgi:hypothetical protein
MAKKFITLAQHSHKYRLFLEDIRGVYKKERKIRPPVPSFTSKQHASMHAEEE